MQEESPQAPQGQPNEPFERKKLVAVGLISLVIIAAAIGLIAMVVNMGSKTPSLEKSAESSAVETLFYDTISNAAKQQQLRIAMYRATYANKADAEGGKNIGTELSSVAELDTTAGKMRSVFATNNTDSPNFNIGRCMDGTSYINTFNSQNKAPTSLDTAAEMLKTSKNIARVTENLVFIPCPKLGLMPSGLSDVAKFRFSDGVFPVTLTNAQAENWKNKVKEAKLFSFKDEGMVERDGKQLKKISFTPKDETTVNDSLYSIFKEAAEINKIKSENPKAEVDYEYISVGPINSGSVGGFYLIDEATKLPVYSELYSTNPDKELGPEGRNGSNIARTKQTYQFGKPVALTLEAPLELLK